MLITLRQKSPCSNPRIATGTSSEVSLLSFDIWSLWLLHGKHVHFALDAFVWQVAAVPVLVCLGLVARMMATPSVHHSLRWVPSAVKAVSAA